MDPRYAQLASNLTSHSTKLKEGDKVLLEFVDVPELMVIALIRAVKSRGAIPFVTLKQSRVAREIAMASDEASLDVRAEIDLAQMKKMDAYISIRGGLNSTELSDVPPELQKLIGQKMKPVLDHRVKSTRWCVLRWPSSGMAQSAGMSTEAFEDFYFKVCNLDYARMIPGMEALKAAMEATDLVEIRGPGTDLRFSIKGIPAIPCGGTCNIPDGEVFTAPVKDSVEGFITFNAGSIYEGTSFDSVRLDFSQGRIIKAVGNNTERLNQILDSDSGARYIGEFALGFNPHILHPQKDILFDEKICGSFHFTPGEAYEEADNGNRSQVHWDMVNIQRPDYGGGTIHFDGRLIRENGLFVPESLQALNPENLV